MTVAISRALSDRLKGLAAARPDDEVCGLLFGSENCITGVEPCANVAADPACRFEIDPAFLIDALRSERNGGPGVLGFFHSHPNGRSEPSVIDITNAPAGDRLCIVIASGDIAAWKFDGASAVRVELFEIA